MRALSIPALGLLVTWSLAACGGTNTPTPGPDAGLPPEDYFGLQKGRCFEYTTADTAQSAPDLGVMVEKIDTVQFSVPTHEVAYRMGGSVAMLDYVAFDGDALVLYKRSFPGGKTYLYDPPLKRLQQPVYPNDMLEASSEARIYDGTGTLLATEQHALRVDVFGESEVPLPMGETVTATKIAFQEKKADGTAAARSEFVTFVPGTGDRTGIDGPVKIDFNFNLDEAQPNLVYKLQKVRDLGDDPTTAETPCGAAP